MAKHEIVIHENTGATSASAPYLGSYISKETLKLESYQDAIAAKCGLPSIQVAAIITGTFEAWEALEKESLVKINNDLGAILGIITGSFATSDAAFDPEKNALELALRLDEDIRLDLVDETPVISTDGLSTKLRLDNVVDVTNPKPYNIIHGESVFRLQGFNMVLTDTGAEAYFEDEHGVKFPLTIDEVVSKQLIKAHVTGISEGCDGKIIVKSRAGDAEGPLQTSFRKVKFLYVQPVGPTPIAASEDGQVKVYSQKDGESATTFTFGNDWDVTGEGLYETDGGTGRRYVMGATLDYGGENPYGLAVEFAADGKSLVLKKNGDTIPSGTYANAKFSLLTTLDGSEFENVTLPAVTLIVA